ncbi:uncharacterized protein LOC133189763 [Saccostrea echinata]|uniref:uncharacterized protein LOC133189763 n=1 Tax=Saccostrea echinata TaxID=191078 RepID=UPI002A7EF328|nr:uncharacterized protein LOC133189763 [Saccostrea echinata]
MGPVPVVLLLWLFSVMLYSSGTDAHPCSYKANGCSIPGNLPFFYKRTFKPACNMHDQCYKCGSYRLYRISRAGCDKRFHKNMLKICRRRGWWSRSRCSRFARIYYWAVRIGGKSRYKKSPEGHCGRVAHCMT